MTISTSTCCGIIPPFISERIINTFDDGILDHWPETVASHQQKLREKRALYLREKKRPQKRCQEASIKIFDAENNYTLPGKRLWKPEKTQDPAAQEAFLWTTKTDDFFRTVFHRNSIDNQGGPFFLTVHYGENYNNAFWTGKQIVYGESSSQYIGSLTKDPEVTAHEIAHGILHFYKNLIYRGEPGAISESYCDVLASMVKQYIKKENVREADWLIGESLIVGGLALRSLKSPGTAYQNHPLFGDDPQTCTFDYYQSMASDHGGVHVNSGILNHAFYLASLNLYEIDPIKYAHSWDGVGKVWYAALEKLSSIASFTDFANAVIETADHEFGIESQEAKAVRYAFKAVRLFNQKPCGRKKCLIS